MSITLAKQRNRLGLTIILLHVVYVFLYLTFGVMGWIPLKHIGVLLGIVIPPMATSAKTVVDHAIRNPIQASDDTQPRLSFLFRVLPVIFVFSHGAIVIGVLFAFSTGQFSLEQIGIVLGVGETAFAVYLGMFVNALFDADSKRKGD